MKKLKKFMFSPKGTLAVFGAAMVLLLLSSIGGAKAALQEYSNIHETQIATEHIGVSLAEESGVTVTSVDSDDNQGASHELALPGIKGEGKDGKAKPGTAYEEKLSVVNNGGTAGSDKAIEQYVRVTIYKSWWKDGAKQKDLYPSFIKLDLDNAVKNGWTIDSSATTQERTVLYYTRPLAVGESVPVVNSITIDPAVSTTTNADGTYPYQGCEFKVEVEVDAVQTHNAEDAILSAWGKEVTVNVNDNGSLSGIR